MVSGIHEHSVKAKGPLAGDHDSVECFSCPRLLLFRLALMVLRSHTSMMLEVFLAGWCAGKISILKAGLPVAGL